MLSQSEVGSTADDFYDRLCEAVCRLARMRRAITCVRESGGDLAAANLVIGAQAFQAVPAKHAPAVVLAIIPNIAAWGQTQIDGALNAAGTSASQLGMAKLGATGVVYHGIAGGGRAVVLRLHPRCAACLDGLADGGAGLRLAGRYLPECCDERTDSQGLRQDRIGARLKGRLGAGGIAIQQAENAGCA